MMVKNITGVLVICLTAAVIESSVTELPPECSDYLIMDDSSRNVHNGYEKYTDEDNDYNCGYDTSPDWHGRNWYRMMPPAGVVITETSLTDHHCGSLRPGWIQGSHPTNEGEQVDALVCFSADAGDGAGGECEWGKPIQITHCGDFYVYYLFQVPACAARYCAADKF